jgi:hypothetical protein
MGSGSTYFDGVINNEENMNALKSKRHSSKVSSDLGSGNVTNRDKSQVEKAIQMKKIPKVFL